MLGERVVQQRDVVDEFVPEVVDAVLEVLERVASAVQVVLCEEGEQRFRVAVRLGSNCCHGINCV